MKKTQKIFHRKILSITKPNGRLGIVLPESVFDTTENKYIRLFLYKYFKIKSVVSLPQLTFEPYTSTKTSLLFAQKKHKMKLAIGINMGSKIFKWKNLTTRALNIKNVYITKKIEKFPSIKDLNPAEEKKIFLKIFRL